MPGKSCCVVGCHNWSEKTKGEGTPVNYFSFPINKEWRSRLVAAVSRSDRSFNPDTAHICSVHFEEGCLLFHGRGMKLITGSLPTKHMPKKSVETYRPPPRHQPTVRPSPPIPEKVVYYSLQDVKKEVEKKDLNRWIKLKSDEHVLVLGIYDDTKASLSRTVSVNQKLEVTIRLEDVVVRNFGSNSLEKTRLLSFLKEVEELTKCTGIPIAGDHPKAYTCSINGKSTTALRSFNCLGGLKTSENQFDEICTACKKLQPLHEHSIIPKPIHPNTPLSSLSREALVQVIKDGRANIRKSNQMLDDIRGSMTEAVAEDVSAGLFKTLEERQPGQDQSFVSLFWEEQKRAFKLNPKGMRWHPMLLRFAIYLNYQSPRAYEALRSAGVLRLPNKSTLRDYTNVIKPKPGFQAHVFEDLKKMAKDLPTEKRFVALMHDEMKVKADLVYDRRSGEVIGFTNAKNWTIDFSEDDASTHIASHVLVFMVVGVNSHIKMTIGHFPTKTATADELYPLFWKAVTYLEITCGLKVISSTSDKAPQNQRLYRMHRVGNEAVVYKTLNSYSEDNTSRHIYFFSDAPHLMKTIRNNVYKSRPGGTRFLWNNDKNILWSHVMQLYNDDRQGQLYRTKLTYDHVYLTPSSTMSVKLAVQVMSNSVAQVMRGYYGPELSETAKLFSLVNRFFDCLNTRSMREAILERKPDTAPYTSQSDPRFQFLEEEFLQYFDGWLAAVKSRHGFSKSERNKMFISYQTHEGIIMTVKSLIEATRYILSQGVPYVLSHVFCQDPLEEHFGRHRGLGARHDNPTVQQFSYQENQLHLQRSLAFQFVPKGNTGGHGEKRPVVVSNSPLKRLKHH